jgi:serine/threonine-protein kinase
MDFGLAYQTGAEKLTKEGQVLGTLAYISPEQATGKPVDARTDIYALGLILYELLSGKRAPGDDGRAPLALRSSDDCLPPSELTPEVPTELDAIVLKCLDRDPNKRFQSMTELSDALSRLETSVSHQVIARIRGSKTKRWPWVVGLAPAMLAIVVLALILVKPAPPSGPEGIALIPLAYEGPPDSAYLRNIVPFLLGEELRDSTGINVAPFDSSRSFGPDDSPAHVAQQLTVGHILGGSIQVSGDQFDATLQLTDSGGDVSWSRDLTGDRREIFDVMTPVAGDLMVALGAGSANDEGLMHRHSSEALTAYMQGRTFLEGWDTARNYTRAEDSFREAFANEESFAEAHAGLALALWRHYQETHEPPLVEEARSAAEKAVSLGPTLPEAHLAKGVVLLGMGRSAEAVVSLEKAQQLAPANDANYRWIAAAYESLGRSEEAEQALQRAIDLRPSFWTNYNRKGIFHLNSGQLELAKALFRKVTELRPESATGYNNLATAHILDGELNEAEPLLLASLRIEPIADSHDNLGFIYYSTGRFEEAAQAFSKAVDMRPRAPLSWGNLGDAYRQLAKEKEMTEAYLRAIDLTERQLEVDPGDRHTRLGYAMQLAGLQRCKEARAQVDRGLGEGPDQPYLNYYAALAFAVCADRNLVIEHMRLALEGGVVADIKTSPDLKPYLDEPSLSELLK